MALPGRVGEPSNASKADSRSLQIPNVCIQRSTLRGHSQPLKTKNAESIAPVAAAPAATFKATVDHSNGAPQKFVGVVGTLPRTTVVITATLSPVAKIAEIKSANRSHILPARLLHV